MYKFNYFFCLMLLTLLACNSNPQSQTNQTGQQASATANDSSSIVSRADYPFDAQLVTATLKELSQDSYEGRKPGTEGHAKAKKYVLEQFKALGLQPINGSYEQPFSALLRGDEDSVSASNLVGYIAGEYHADKYIVVGAHYDHVGIRRGEIHNGADDNASGVGGLLGIASYYQKHKPEHSIFFIAFDAEESGLQGAKYFVKNSLIPKSQMAMMVNMDMISRSEAKEIYACGSHHYPYLKEFLEKASEKSSGAQLMFGHDEPSLGRDDWTNASDHSPFHEAEIPFVYFGVEDHKDYHKPGDDFEKINLDFYLDCVELIVKSVDSFDKGLGKVERRGESPVEEKP